MLRNMPTRASLARNGFARLVLALDYQAEVIRGNFGLRFAGMVLDYVTETSPLGTGGATRLALTRCQVDHAFVFYGDTFLDVAADEVERMWILQKSPILVTRQVPDTLRYGRVLVDGTRVTGFTEKGIAGPGLINAGCYVLGRDSLSAFDLYAPFSIEADYFTPRVATERVDMFLTDGLFIDIGIPADYALAQTLLAPYA